MNNFEKDLLNELLDAYERSKLSKEGTKVKRSIKLTPKNKSLQSYTYIDSYKYVDFNDAVLKKLEDLNFINLTYENDTFKSLTLNLDNVDKIYEYLSRDKKSDELFKINDVLNSYSFDNFVDDFISYLKEFISTKYDFHHKYFQDANELNLILKSFKGIFELKEDTKKRDFSVKYLSDSKLFESLENKVIKIIKDFDWFDHFEDEDILSSYNIVKNSTYALIKNGLLFKLNNAIINLDELGYEFSLSDEMIKNLDILNINSKRIITVENLTSFYKLNDKEATIIYLAGFHNHTKQNLLKKIYSKYPSLEYYHFSDIDAGGFLIFLNLKEKTNIPFIPYKMSIEEFENNKEHLKQLTSNDIKRLKKLYDNPKAEIFKSVIEYMLKNDCKLEQELLD